MIWESSCHVPFIASSRFFHFFKEVEKVQEKKRDGKCEFALRIP